MIKRVDGMLLVEQAEIDLMQLQIDCLSRAVLQLAGEMVKVGMAEVSPDHAEMIQLGSWGINLLTNGLGYKLEEIKDWEQDDV